MEMGGACEWHRQVFFFLKKKFLFFLTLFLSFFSFSFFFIAEETVVEFTLKTLGFGVQGFRV